MKRKALIAALAVMTCIAMAGCGDKEKQEPTGITGEPISSEALDDGTRDKGNDAGKGQSEKASAQEAQTGEAGEGSSAAQKADGSIYVGKFVQDDEAELEVAEGSDGKYEVKISIYGLTYLDDGVGTLEGDGLHFTATDATGNPIGGIITLEGDEIKLTFTESTWGLLENGTSFLFGRE